MFREDFIDETYDLGNEHLYDAFLRTKINNIHKVWENIADCCKSPSKMF